MRQAQGSIPAEAFFLKTDTGDRFCLFHAPAGAQCLGAVLYVPPFGEEMNKARRMAALQARDLAARGFGVLQVDLFGCGDSSGDFAEARWDRWKEDLRIADDWLRSRLGAPVSLWGLRLGALLALDYARSTQQTFSAIVLWQPVLNGASFLTQFLRLRVANEMLIESDEKGAGKSSGTQGMRDALQNGISLEVAGYEISPALAMAIDALDAVKLEVTSCPVHWLEAVAAPNRPMPPAAARVVGAWQRNGVKLHTHAVACQPFWATQEIMECPDFLAATSRVFSENLAPSSNTLVAGHEL